MIKQIAWCDEARDGLSKALPYPLIMSIVEQEVRLGVSQLWRCENDLHQAYVVTRMDTNPTEWVIVAFQGTGMQQFGKLFVDAAADRKVTLRAHVTNPVVERLLRRLGLKRDEVVLRKVAT